MPTKEIIISFIEDLKNEKITDTSINLFENGILTSLDVLDLISFIEQTFKITFSEDDIDMENLGTIEGIVNLIEKVKSRQ